MNFKEYGNSKNQTIMLLHGGGDINEQIYR